MRVHFSQQAFDYQTLRAMAYTTFGGAEPGEVLATVARIEDGDTGSWYTEWRNTAERVERLADDAADAGSDRSARAAYFRAHTYYRTAEFFLASNDPRRRPTYEKSREMFRAGLDFLDTPVETLSIPYDGTTLPGYLFLPADDDTGEEPHQTIVCLGGFDSLAEELYFLCGVPEALARGYAVVVFEGPGQGAPLRYEGLTARPDWEHVVGPVLDALSDDDSVDSEGVGLVGVSLGGYYAPRAAAFEDRIAACVTFDHMHDLWLSSAFDAPRLAELLLRAPDVVVNGLAALGARFSLESRWAMENAKWVFGVESAAEVQRTLRTYSLTPVSHRIECPVLVLAGEDDHFVPLEMAAQFVDQLTCPTTVRVFTTEEGAGEHCQVGNLTLATGVIYDWFDETMVSEAEAYASS
ncbi:alpha/beta hydrolase family protein [Haloferax profundi]|uniref:Dipeptidyl aminopeptidase n=1 Tax=Haloferax profundi TaxID=1544718 RepID=A0A0W1SVP2_9EURY|nr:alpha/beta fold hydrolase [Haloferax profundi]KTG30292.1 dipeptidyl aminopeptidase [Haloferax profundi]